MNKEDLHIEKIKHNDPTTKKFVFIGPWSADRTQRVFQYLRHNTVTTSLFLSDNDLPGYRADCIGEMLVDNASLKHMSLKDCKNIKDEGMIQICWGLRFNTALTSLDLSWMCLERPSAYNLYRAMERNKTLTKLDLSHNNIIDAGPLVAELINPNNSITDLDLSYNDLYRGAVGSHLGRALMANTRLLSLKLDVTSMPEACLVSISSAMLHNTTLEILSIAIPRLNASSIENFANVIRTNTTLRHLNITGGGSDYYEQQFNLIAEGFRFNKTLEFFDCAFYYFTETARDTFLSALKDNTTLTDCGRGLNDRFHPKFNSTVKQTTQRNKTLYQLVMNRWHDVLFGELDEINLARQKAKSQRIG